VTPNTDSNSTTQTKSGSLSKTTDSTSTASAIPWHLFLLFSLSFGYDLRCSYVCVCVKSLSFVSFFFFSAVQEWIIKLKTKWNFSPFFSFLFHFIIIIIIFYYPFLILLLKHHRHTPTHWLFFFCLFVRWFVIQEKKKERIREEIKVSVATAIQRNKDNIISDR